MVPTNFEAWHKTPHDMWLLFWMKGMIGHYLVVISTNCCMIEFSERNAAMIPLRSKVVSLLFRLVMLNLSCFSSIVPSYQLTLVWAYKPKVIPKKGFDCLHYVFGPNPYCDEIPQVGDILMVVWWLSFISLLTNEDGYAKSMNLFILFILIMRLCNASLTLAAITQG